MSSRRPPAFGRASLPPMVSLRCPAVNRVGGIGCSGVSESVLWLDEDVGRVTPHRSTYSYCCSAKLHQLSANIWVADFHGLYGLYLYRKFPEYVCDSR